MLLLAAAFILPVVLAKLALENDWFNKAATNKGQLLQPPLDFSPIGSQSEPKWRLVYVLPQHCAAACKNAIYSINQVRQALGRQVDRLNAVVLSTDNSDQTVLSKLGQSDFERLVTHPKQLQQVFGKVSVDGIYLVDTLNNVVLYYPSFADQQQTIMQSREILADIRKLLKLSRIG